MHFSDFLTGVLHVNYQNPQGRQSPEFGEPAGEQSKQIWTGTHVITHVGYHWTMCPVQEGNYDSACLKLSTVHL
jgi:hypothetical protein